MQTILDDIKTENLKSMYLLFGEEAYLINQYRDKLVEAMAPGADAMNLNRFEGRGIDENAFIEIAETLPFFAEYRTILVTDSGFFKKPKKNEDEDQTAHELLFHYLKEPCNTTRFIFVEKEVDKRNRFYKLVKESGRAVEIKMQDEDSLKKWIVKILAKENKRITGNALDSFLARTGSEMSNIVSELDKLISYTYGRNDIYPEDIEAVITTRESDYIFEMITAIALRQQKKALHLYYELLSAKKPPLLILSLLSRQFNLLLQTKELRRKGYNKSSIAEKLGMQPFIAGKYMDQSVKFEEADLKDALRDCLDSEEAIKSGRMKDRLAVEMIIVKYSAVTV